MSIKPNAMISTSTNLWWALKNTKKHTLINNYSLNNLYKEGENIQAVIDTLHIYGMQDLLSQQYLVEKVNHTCKNKSVWVLLRYKTVFDFAPTSVRATPNATLLTSPFHSITTGYRIIFKPEMLHNCYILPEIWMDQTKKQESAQDSEYIHTLRSYYWFWGLVIASTEISQGHFKAEGKEPSLWT